MFKIELENSDFRKSLYSEWTLKKKKKKKKKNELRLGAGIILNQELTYNRHWGKWAAGACQCPDTIYMMHNFKYKTIPARAVHSNDIARLLVGTKNRLWTLIHHWIRLS